MKPNPENARSLILSFFYFVLILLTNSNSGASELYFIDAHSQVDQNLENIEKIIQCMNAGGVYRTILAARAGRQPEEIASFAENYPNRIVPAVRTKSGAYNKNKPKYYKKLRKQLDSGQYKAKAEVLMYHAQKGSKAPEVIVFPDDKRVQAALNAAIENSWPFVIHIEFRSLAGEKRQKFMVEMEKLLDAHPRHPFALNHMGQLNVNEVFRLIKNHNNIYFLTSHTTPVIVQSSSEPWVNMFQGVTLSKEWKELLLHSPDRFVFALDNVWKTHWKEFYLDQMDYWCKVSTIYPYR
jgi:predicted TIM-barrel fold metal-dependent hydrolase